MIELKKCPNCGEEVRFDDTKVSSFCMSCGQKIYRDTKQASNKQPYKYYSKKTNMNNSAINRNPVRPAPKEDNLIISYISEHPAVNLQIHIISNGIKDYFTNGKSKGYNFAPGIHSIDFKIGKRTYRREIIIYPNAQPVMVQASWSRGTARIAIMNPQAPNPQIEEPQLEKPQFCSKCGSSVKPDSYFCSRCGNHI